MPQREHLDDEAAAVQTRHKLPPQNKAGIDSTSSTSSRMFFLVLEAFCVSYHAGSPLSGMHEVAYQRMIP